ncbi:restriction endonuclease [Sulfurimonas sp.]|uniref:restriction endonuclease n=1 Tax=Sulfurimonas sp. TaxID=2022749 RepID=UPI0025EAD233|nr:restriction endonuclease [Sulfurimonas sp.]
MKDIINNYFNNFDFDIRKSKNARFIDHKVTADVLTIISDCVIEFSEQTNNIEFTSKDIWNFKYSSENIKEVFGKPNVLDRKAKNEYNKFFGQSLIALAYTKILIGEKRSNKWYFKINNKQILKFIAIRERNSLMFLNIYLTKVLNDSDMYKIFNDFFDLQTKESLYLVKNEYKRIIRLNTKTQSELDLNRMFPKVLNPLAYDRKKLGIVGGYISKEIIGFNDLFYNRKNWRDIKKKRTETRNEYEDRAKSEVQRSKDAYVKYTINKATNIVRKLHSPTSEINDDLSVGDATQVHHIFMKSEYPQIESYIENLILLTGTQHNTKAHPNNNTRMISKEYQLLCLLAKSDSIEKYYNTYSKEDFLFVLKVGLNTELSNNIKFREIKEKLVELYNVV